MIILFPTTMVTLQRHYFVVVGPYIRNNNLDNDLHGCENVEFLQEKMETLLFSSF